MNGILKNTNKTYTIQMEKSKLKMTCAALKEKSQR